MMIIFLYKMLKEIIQIVNYFKILKQKRYKTFWIPNINLALFSYKAQTKNQLPTLISYKQKNLNGQNKLMIPKLVQTRLN